VPCENLNNGELVDRLVEVQLELHRLDALKAEVDKRVLQDLQQAPMVDRSVDMEYLRASSRRPELDKLHVHFGMEITKRGLRDVMREALSDARRRMQ
jgi:hypothetical protein